MPIDLHYRQILAVDPDHAWQSLHQDLCRLAPALPNVSSIRERQRDSGAAPASIDYIWSIEREVVPSPARPFLKSLLDEVCADTHWHHGARRVEFLFYSEALAELFSCRGHFLLTPQAKGTDMTIDAVLEVAPHILPGVPKLLARSIMPTIERSVRDVIEPSLAAVPGALDQLLRSAPRD